MKNDEILKKQKYSDEIADWLRQSIISGVFEPGERLIETSIAEKLGVSRIPVREAMKTLASEGVIVESLVRGYEVWTPTDESVEEIIMLRFALEALAYEVIPKMLDQKTFQSLSKQISVMKHDFIEGQFQEAIHHDRLFHENLIKMSGLQRVILFWTQIITQWEVILYIGARNKLTFTENDYANIHQDILNALKEDNVEEATNILKLHTDYSIRLIKTVMNHLRKEDKTHED